MKKGYKLFLSIIIICSMSYNCFAELTMSLLYIGKLSNESGFVGYKENKYGLEIAGVSRNNVCKIFYRTFKSILDINASHADYQMGFEFDMRTFIIRFYSQELEYEGRHDPIRNLFLEFELPFLSIKRQQ